MNPDELLDIPTEELELAVPVEEPAPEIPVQNEEVGREFLGAGSPTDFTEVYGSEFPAAVDDFSRTAWSHWSQSLWDKTSESMSPIIHLVERNRLFRQGIQWISSANGQPWRAPTASRDTVRVVENLVGPALDLRAQVVSENRPGFRANPASSDPEDMKKAEAAQALLEYQFDNQRMEGIRREAKFWAGTDGVAFIELLWDADKGPWEELPVFGSQAAAGATERVPLGDIVPRVRRVEQIRVSPGASFSVPPEYLLVQEVCPSAPMVARYGPQILDKNSTQEGPGAQIRMSGLFKGGYEQPEIDQLLKGHPTINVTTLYVVPSALLPEGLMVRSVGCYAVFVGPLLPGVIPVAVFRDGTSDPSFFPQPRMVQWLEAQQRINMVKSRWVQAVRTNAGGKVIAREGAIVSETMTAGETHVMTVRDARPFDDLIKPMQQMSVGNDAKELLDREIKSFEDMSGYNDVARGQMTDDQSGRAILAIREQLERQFAPDVTAAAEAMQEWAKITLAWCRWGYQMDRTLGVVGEGRPDLARVLCSDDIDGVTDVFVDPETMMPMPRSLRLFVLNDLQSKGLIDPREFRRRFPFAWTRGIQSPDEDQESRARRVVEAIRQSGDPNALPMLWVDDEAIHQDILQRELLLPDNLDPMIREAAWQRWQMLANQAAMKAAGMPPQPGMGSPSGAPAGPEAGTQPEAQPTMAAGADSPLAATPLQAQMVQTQNAGPFAGDDTTAGRQFDQMQAIQ